MAAPVNGTTIEGMVGGFPGVNTFGLNTAKAANFSGLTVDTSGNTVVPGTLNVTGATTLAAGMTSSAATGAGIGYATGAGGAVTQATNRTTGVTLHKLAGQITTSTASLAAETAAAFIVTNSTVALGDVVVVSQQSGAVGVMTTVEVIAVAAGSFTLSVMNNNAAAGVAETGALIINFAVIKSVAA